MAIYKCSGRERFTEDGEPFCSYEAARRWDGRCPGCGRWYPIRKYGTEHRPTEKTPPTFADVSADESSLLVHVKTGMAEFDRVLGGGLVRGYITLIGGERSSGKSTLLMTVAASYARVTRPVLYATGENTIVEVGTYARRLKLITEHVKVIATTDVDEVLERCRQVSPHLLVLDSLQRMVSSESASPKGSIGQGLAVLSEIRAYCKKHSCSALIINHLSKDGSFAGSESLQHDVDGILTIAFPDEKHKSDRPYVNDYAVRVLVVEKTRQGGELERAYYRMTEEGLRPIEDTKDDSGGFAALLRRRIGKGDN